MERKHFSEERVPINIHPSVRDRLNNFLLRPETPRGMGFSEFIDNALDDAESGIIVIVKEFIEASEAVTTDSSVAAGLRYHDAYEKLLDWNSRA